MLVMSDIHFACDAEKDRRGHESRVIGNPWLRRAVSVYRRFIWLRDPFAHNHLLHRVIDLAGEPELVVALGDYTCDTAFIGVADEAAFLSARECLDTLSTRYGDRFLAVIGDHELGKFSLFGNAGGLRLRSYDRAVGELGLRPFWQRRVGRRLLLGVTSTLVALPIFQQEMLPDERERWKALRNDHLGAIAEAFDALGDEDPVLLFCHDPTALPFLREIPQVAGRMHQIERTLFGHLHSPLIFWKSRLLAGIPEIGGFGTSVRKMTGALRKAGGWKEFKPVLCPSLAGIELLRDGGYCTVDLPADGADPGPVRIERHRLNR